MICNHTLPASLPSQGTLARARGRIAMQLNRNTTAGIGKHIGGAAALSALALLVAGLAAPIAQAQNFPITPGQRATAEQVASKGVPISELG